MAVSTSLEADTVDGGVHFGNAYDLLDLLAQGGFLLQVDDFAAEALGLGEALGNHVADDDDGSTEKMTGGGASRVRTGPPAGDVDD